jgi:hypothetical protein
MIYKTWNYLKGKKTYICAIAIGIVAALHATGYVNDALYEQLNAVLYPATVAAIRHSMESKV